MKNDELKHYGVLGMKWGVRKERTQTKTSTTDKSEKVKKIAKRGATVASVVLAAYGGYKVNEFLNSCSFTVNGKSVSRKEFASAVKAVAKSLS